MTASRTAADRDARTLYVPGEPAPVVPAQLKVVRLPRHPGDDVADTGQCVEPAVQQPQFRLVGRHEAEADRGAEKAGASRR